jgi:hypothetical protein
VLIGVGNSGSEGAAVVLLLVALGPGTPVEPVSFRCSFLARHCGLVSAHGASVTHLALRQAFAALYLARLGGPFTLISEPFPAAGEVARVGFAVTLIRDSVALICHSVARAQAHRSRVRLRLAHLDLNLARLDLGLAILEGRITLQALFARAGRCTLVFRRDYLRPAPFQRRAGTLERGRVPVQVSARSVAPLLPKRHGSVMHDCRLRMASRGLLVAGRRSGHPHDYDAGYRNGPALIAITRLLNRPDDAEARQRVDGAVEIERTGAPRRGRALAAPE